MKFQCSDKVSWNVTYKNYILLVTNVLKFLRKMHKQSQNWSGVQYPLKMTIDSRLPHAMLRNVNVFSMSPKCCNRGGGNWPRKGVWGCAALKRLFTPLLQFARVPFQAKGSVHKTPFWENLWILATTASIFAQISAHKPQNLEIFSSQAPKFGNFQFTSPQIWKFSVHKAPFFRGKYQFASPTLRKSGPHTPTWKKLSAPPPPRCNIDQLGVSQGTSNKSQLSSNM